GLTVVFARLNETTPARHVIAPISARIAEDTEFAGNIKSKAGAADEADHMSAAAIPPSATGGTFNSRPLRPCVCTARFNQNRTASLFGRVEVLAVSIRLLCEAFILPSCSKWI